METANEPEPTAWPRTQTAIGVLMGSTMCGWLTWQAWDIGRCNVQPMTACIDSAYRDGAYGGYGMGPAVVTLQDSLAAWFELVVTSTVPLPAFGALAGVTIALLCGLAWTDIRNARLLLAAEVAIRDRDEWVTEASVWETRHNGAVARGDTWRDAYSKVVLTTWRPLGTLLDAPSPSDAPVSGAGPEPTSCEPGVSRAVQPDQADAETEERRARWVAVLTDSRRPMCAPCCEYVTDFGGNWAETVDNDEAPCARCGTTTKRRLQSRVSL